MKHDEIVKRNFDIQEAIKKRRTKRGARAKISYLPEYFKWHSEDSSETIESKRRGQECPYHIS
jgi:hypothetical protein